MTSEPDDPDFIIDGLGGTSAVARMLRSKPSTVNSWRKNGIPESRLDHMRLRAAADGLDWPERADDAHAAIGTGSETVTPSGKCHDLTGRAVQA